MPPASGNLLTDALGSTTALTDGFGAVQTEYSYEPFGGTTTSGASTGSALGFTGREDDGTGLYFYRARFYDPRLQRFISEDPIGFAAGDVNLHAYVGNAPTNWTDPLGLFYYMPIGDPCQPGSGKNPPAWVAFLCRPDVQLAIDIVGMARGGRGGRPPGGRPGGLGRPGAGRPGAGRPTAGQSAQQPRPNAPSGDFWEKLGKHHGKTRTGGEGRNKQYYEWDRTHGDMEVYDRYGRHIGSADPNTGVITKPPKPGRTIKP